ncbi:alpha/beta fold hydrolase [Amycolatopsis saalfeldensis]|uniref:3-oxoadipate enol-lactonase n=1 Tax=Amycolatopsis saalfeldensis TaxID=394193 RepID=A0A1H8XD10_9PSEU|nr:alpha/beta hydrolase [Amycolatopsis saalfeldensis]SEP37713.1 3-oxoadipate enol-lactonase [Amycolatopsis saalfeldensis]
MTERIETADGTLAYRVVGDGPRPVLLVHSLALDGSWFEPLAAELGDGFRCVLPDLRGHGASDGGAISLAALADDLALLAGHLRIERCAAAGISLGGMVVQALAHRHPELLGAAVLIATAGAYDDVARAAARARAAAARAPGGLAELADATMTRWFGDRPGPLLARAREQFLRGDPEIHAACLEAMTAVGDFTVPSSVPALVLGGEDDVSTPPPVLEELHASVPHSKLRFAPGGHLTAFTHPAPVAALLAEFLASAPKEARLA